MGAMRSRLRNAVCFLACAASLGCGRTVKDNGSRPDAAEGGAPAAIEPAQPAPNCAVAIAAHGARHCAAYQDGSVWCWGTGGMPGPSNFEASAKPKRVEGVNGAQQLKLGPRTSCALTVERRLVCWGDNESGQIDDSGSSPLPPTSAALGGFEPVGIKAFGLADTQTCMVNGISHVYCRGLDGAGHKSSRKQVDVAGNPDTTMPGSGVEVFDERGRVFSLNDWDKPAVFSTYGSDNAWVGSGYPETCVLKRWGSLWCNEYVDPPGDLFRARLALGENVAQAGAGDMFVCALTKNRSVWCEGYNQAGQAATGDNALVAAGSFVAGLKGVHALSVNAYSACALKGDGSVWCWGAYAEGQRSNVPAQVSGCTQQSVEPPEARGSDQMPRDEAQRLAEAVRARAQAICACKSPAGSDANCIESEDSAPNSACLNALGGDQAKSWDWEAQSTWEEVACYLPAICADSPDALPNCPPPPIGIGTAAPWLGGYCRRQTCALDLERTLTRSQICDGVPDCDDGSDERNCQPGTPFFECRQGTILLGSVCDAVPDCDDGSDEQYCP